MWSLRDVIFTDHVTNVKVGSVVKLDGNYVAVHYPALRPEELSTANLDNCRLLRKDELVVCVYVYSVYVQYTLHIIYVCCGVTVCVYIHVHVRVHVYMHKMCCVLYNNTCSCLSVANNIVHVHVRCIYMYLNSTVPCSLQKKPPHARRLTSFKKRQRNSAIPPSITS